VHVCRVGRQEVRIAIWNENFLELKNKNGDGVTLRFAFLKFLFLSAFQYLPNYVN
jgi:hypothetical protein